MPTKFLISNLEGVLKYINETYQIGNRADVKRIWMDMRAITEIDIFCICLLLAQINKLATRKVSCYGNYPDNALKKQFIIESGFLKLAAAVRRKAQEAIPKAKRWLRNNVEAAMFQLTFHTRNNMLLHKLYCDFPIRFFNSALIFSKILLPILKLYYFDTRCSRGYVKIWII